MVRFSRLIIPMMRDIQVQPGGEYLPPLKLRRIGKTITIRVCFNCARPNAANPIVVIDPGDLLAAVIGTADLLCRFDCRAILNNSLPEPDLSIRPITDDRPTMTSGFLRE
jgi:hypothetical protein